MAKSKNSTPAEGPNDPPSQPGIGVAVVVPWIAFWGWVALDSALAYRKSQAAIEQGAVEAANEPPPSEPNKHDWPQETLERLQGVRKLARISMIGAPIIAVLGSLALGRLRSKSKS